MTKALGTNKDIIIYDFANFIMKNRLIILTIAIVVFTLSAIFSIGYFHFDEHFQVIEFAELKSGHNSISDLAWEYGSRIRSSFQPILAHLGIQFFRMLSIRDPYMIMTLLRIITAVIALVSITFFVKRTAFLIETKMLFWYQLTSYFLCFIPFINVRFSSEAYSGIVFIIAIGVFYTELKYKDYLLGLMLGLAFLLRFQTAFMSIGFLIWLIVIYKAKVQSVLKILFAIALVLIFGAFLDTWFYEKLTFSFYNYFQVNIVDGTASNWGISPWYYYIVYTFDINWALALLIWLCMLCQFVINSRSLVSFLLFPFIVAHFIIPHKELRFLFPACNFLPLVIVSSISILKNRLKLNRIFPYFFKTLAVFLVGLNLVYLLALTFIPADFNGRINVTRYIYYNFPNRPIKLYSSIWNNPYRPIPVNQNFYLNKNVKIVTLNLDNLVKMNNDTVNLLVTKNDELAKLGPLLQSFSTKKIYSGIPDWILSLTDFLGYRNCSFMIYQIKNY
jgi:phosphatidylinositol glycan class B